MKKNKDLWENYWVWKQSASW